MNFKQLAQTIATAATLLIAQPIQAETFYFHNDHLGTPQALTDDSGTVVWQGNYSPFGEVNETTDTVEQNIRFPGQYFEEETGLHYNYFRDYDPATGRYIESDPIGLDGGINTFGYGYQNPVLNTDPTGERGGRIPAWVVAYVCKKDPKRCKEFVKCVINPASCKKRFCQKSPNRIYHGSNNNGVCEAGACRPEDSLGTRIVKANAALACAAVRKFVSVACHGGSMDSGHRREYNEAVKRAKDCAGGGCL